MEKFICYQLESGTICFVPVPKDSFNYWLNPIIIGYFHFHTPQLEGMKDIDTHTVDLGKFNWELLGMFSNLKDKDLKDIMPKTDKSIGAKLIKGFIDFNCPDAMMDTPLEAINSLSQYLELNLTEPYVVLLNKKT